MHTRIVKLIASVFSAVAVAGCGASITGAPIPGELDVRKLNVGNYPIEPIDSTQEYIHDYESGKTLAAIRLADIRSAGGLHII